MNKKTNNAEENFKAGESWEGEIINGLRSQRNILAVVAVLALAIALMAIIAVASLTPLKRVDPFVIEVDKSTGRAEVLSLYDGDIQTLSISEQLSKYFIGKYLVARESHNPNLDIEENYLLVQELAEGQGFNSYANRFIDGSPNNPFERYGANTARIEIASISFLRNDTATVRYSIIESRPQQGDTTTHYIDILNFKFTNVPNSEEARLKNPLGFKVTEFRTDQELLN